MLNLKDMLWNRIAAEGGPSKRAWHGAAAVGKFMYVFGGLTDIKKCCNQLFKFDLVEKVWEKIEVEGSPSPRCGAGVLALEGFIMILGGKTQNDESCSEVYILDIDANYQKFRDNAMNYGEVYSAQSPGLEPPPIPKELAVSRRYVRKSVFDPSTFI